MNLEERFRNQRMGKGPVDTRIDAVPQKAAIGRLRTRRSIMSATYGQVGRRVNGCRVGNHGNSGLSVGDAFGNLSSEFFSSSITVGAFRAFSGITPFPGLLSGTGRLALTQPKNCRAEWTQMAKRKTTADERDGSGEGEGKRQAV